MAESNIIQMHDFEGNNQYPVTLASLVYDEDGETVGKKLALLLDWFEWGDEKETSVKTKYHFWSEGQLGAGGIGEESGGGEGGIGTITGIYVNGVTYNEPDELGVLTIPNYPTSLEWANIVGKPTHLSQFTDNVVAGHYLPLTGGTIKSPSHIPLLIETTSETNYATIRFVTLSTQRTLGIKGDGTLFVTNAGSWDAEYPILHSGNVGSYALRIGVRETSGDANEINEAGIIGFTEELANTPFWYGNLLTITTNPNYYVGQIAIQYNGTMAVRGRSASTWSDWQTVLTPSNIGNYALSYSGGKLSNSATTLLVVDSTSGREAGIRFALSDVSKGWVGYNTNNGVHLYSYGTGNNILGIKDDGTPHYSGKTLIHEGNIREYNAGGLAHSNGTVGAVVNSSCNVTIGSSDLAGTTYKMSVDGKVHIRSTASAGMTEGAGSLIVGNGAVLMIDANDIQAKTNGTTSGPLYINDWGGNVLLCAQNKGNVGIGTSAPDEMLHVAGNIRLKNANDYGCYLKFGDRNLCYLYEDSDDHLKIYADKGIALLTNGKGVTTDTSLTIGSAVLSWDSVNNALKIEGNVYTTGQLSAGGVGTEVQKVFDIAATNNATTANQPYTAYLTHNLNTYDLAVVVYEVTLQSDGITETLTQVLADVTLTDENKVTVYFASRKIGKKYRIVIIG